MYKKKTDIKETQRSTTRVTNKISWSLEKKGRVLYIPRWRSIVDQLAVVDSLFSLVVWDVHVLLVVGRCGEVAIVAIRDKLCTLFHGPLPQTTTL